MRVTRLTTILINISLFIPSIHPQLTSNIQLTASIRALEPGALASDFGASKRTSDFVLVGRVLTRTSDGLRAVFGHVCEASARATGFTAWQENRPRSRQLFKVGLMILVAMRAETWCLRAY